MVVRSARVGTDTSAKYNSHMMHGAESDMAILSDGSGDHFGQERRGRCVSPVRRKSAAYPVRYTEGVLKNAARRTGCVQIFRTLEKRDAKTDHASDDVVIELPGNRGRVVRRDISDDEFDRWMRTLLGRLSDSDITSILDEIDSVPSMAPERIIHSNIVLAPVRSK